MREFGPAAIEDLIPRLKRLAGDLDAAHAAGFVHGRIHPSKVFITDTATWLLGARVLPASVGDPKRWPKARPYTAPEVAAGGASPASDQFSLAAIAYVWMFGRPIAGPAARAIDVRAMAGVDRAALSDAFTRALAPEPARRFASCAEFCNALAAAAVPALQLIAGDEGEDPVEPFLPEDPAAAPDPPIVAAEPDLDSIDFRVPLDARGDGALSAADGPLSGIRDLETAPVVTPVPAWQPGVTLAHERTSPRFGATALVFATLVGSVFGFAAGYMARPRALQHAPIASMGAQGSPSRPEAVSGAQGTEGAQGAQRAEGASGAATEAPAPRPPSAASAPGAPASIGSLLVRSSPSGASVQVDGMARGETPLVLRELELGTRVIVVTRRGYVPEERRVALTASQPSRSIDVRLSAASASAAAGPSGEISPELARSRASAGGPAGPASSGVLVVESRPTGAAVSVNGKASGTTPLRITDLPPGQYRVTLSLAGYRDFATTVRVVAGERVRAAASLTAQEQE